MVSLTLGAEQLLYAHPSPILNELFQSCREEHSLKVGNLYADSHLQLLQHNEMPKTAQKVKNAAR